VVDIIESSDEDTKKPSKTRSATKNNKNDKMINRLKEMNDTIKNKNTKSTINQQKSEDAVIYYDRDQNKKR